VLSDTLFSTDLKKLLSSNHYTTSFTVICEEKAYMPSFFISYISRISLE